jgi:15-cis-phytoene synthase
MTDTTSTSTAMIRASTQVLANNSRSFRLASHFLPAEARDDAAVLYAVCRLIDDTADEAPDLERARFELGQLRAELSGEAPARPLIAEFVQMAHRTGIDLAIVFELINGVESDLGQVCFHTDRDLLRYSYRVAGTVGLMMSAVLGVRAQAALPHAIDLGIAMQITNICRDVLEDARRGRVYIPASRLAEAGITPAQVLDETVDRQALAGVIEDLLDLAESYYDSAQKGMGYIPGRCRVGILVASRVYRAIGLRLRRLGADPMKGRTVVPGLSKAWWVATACASWVEITLFRSTSGHDHRLHQVLVGLPGVLHG